MSNWPWPSWLHIEISVGHFSFPVFFTQYCHEKQIHFTTFSCLYDSVIPKASLLIKLQELQIVATYLK